MVGWLVRILMILAGAITGLFVARDSLHFQAWQMVVAVVLFALMITVIAFWPNLKKLFTSKK